MMDLVIATTAIIVTMALLFCLCCLCMKYSDLKLKCYLMDLAKRKGIKVDLDELEPKNSCQSPHANENCTIMIPDVGIIL